MGNITRRAIGVMAEVEQLLSHRGDQASPRTMEQVLSSNLQSRRRRGGSGPCAHRRRRPYAGSGAGANGGREEGEARDGRPHRL